MYSDDDAQIILEKNVSDELANVCYCYCWTYIEKKTFAYLLRFS